MATEVTLTSPEAVHSSNGKVVSFPAKESAQKPNQPNLQPEQKLSYTQAIIHMIAGLLKIEEELLNAGIKNQTNQSIIQKKSSEITIQVSKDERKEIAKQERAAKHKSFWQKVLKAVLPIISVATILIGFAVAGPAGALIAGALVGLSQSGALDKLFKGIKSPALKIFAKVAFTLAVTVAAGGAGAATAGAQAGKAAEEAGVEAAAGAASNAAESAEQNIQAAVKEVVEENGAKQAEQASAENISSEAVNASSEFVVPVNQSASQASNESAEEASKTVIERILEKIKEAVSRLTELLSSGNSAEETAVVSTKAERFNTYSKLALSQALPTVNPTQDILYQIFRGFGISKDDAQLAAGVASSIVNLAASSALLYKTFTSEALDGIQSAHTGLTTAVNHISTLALFGGSSAQALANGQIGKYSLLQSKLLRVQAVLAYVNSVTGRVTDAASDNLDHQTSELTNLSKQFSAQNRGFVNYTLAQYAEAQALLNHLA